MSLIIAIWSLWLQQEMIIMEKIWIIGLKLEMHSLSDRFDMFSSAKACLHIADYNSPHNYYLYKDLEVPIRLLNVTRATIINHRQHEYINRYIGGKIKITIMLKILERHIL